MATVFLVTVVGVLGLTAVADRSALRVPLPIAIGVLAFVLYAAGLHLLILDCARCTANLAPKIGMLVLVLWAGFAGWPSLVRRAPTSSVSQTGIVAGMGMAIGSLLLLTELAFDAPIHRLTDAVPPSETVDGARYNRMVAAFVLLAWPIAGMLRQAGNRWLAVLLVAAAMAMAGLGFSAAAILMAVVSLMVFGLMRALPVALPRLGAGAMIAVVVLAPVIFALGLPASQTIQNRISPSFVDRLEIWDHTARTIREGPWYGHGITAQRTLPLQDGGNAYRYHIQPVTHAHNMALQWWLEFGMAGPVVLISLILLTVRGIGGLDPGIRPYAAATAAAAATVSLVGYGFWQETWLGMIGMSVIAIRLLAAARTIRSEP